MENLSQEERDKIMAVMACAELDSKESAMRTSSTIPQSRTSDSFFKIEKRLVNFDNNANLAEILIKL